MNKKNYEEFFIEQNVRSFNKKNFTKILNLGNLYKKNIIDNKNKNIIKLISKKRITKNFLINVFNSPENIENNQFITSNMINKIHEDIDFEYIFEYSIPMVEMSNKLFFYVNKNSNDNDVLKIVQEIIDSLTFFVSYCLYINTPFDDVPIFKIYYTSLLKSLHDNPEIPFGVEQINSAMTQYPSIMIWRKEEIIRCVLHELIHYYNLEFRFYTYPTKLKFEIYNLYRINALTSIRPNESFCETFANIFNIIIFLMKTKKYIGYEDFIKSLIKEINFSILQIAKIFVFLKYENCKDFYLPSINGYDLRQTNTDVLCYFYFKTKLLINLDKFLDILNPNNKEHVFNIKYSSKNSDFFTYYQKIITEKNEKFEMVINKYMDKIYNIKTDEFLTEGLSNNNLRFTLIENIS